MKKNVTVLTMFRALFFMELFSSAEGSSEPQQKAQE